MGKRARVCRGLVLEVSSFANGRWALAGGAGRGADATSAARAGSVAYMPHCGGASVQPAAINSSRFTLPAAASSTLLR